MVFRKNWARTAVILVLLTVFGYESNLDGFISIITDTLNSISIGFTGKPIKIPAKKVA